MKTKEKILMKTSQPNNKVRESTYALLVRSEDKKRVRLNIITHLLSQIPYRKLPREKIKLPERQKRKGYKEPDYKYRFVAEKF